MTGGIDVGGMDRRARTAGYRDGLLEIFAAVVLSTIALAWIASPGLVGIWAAVVTLYGWRVVERIKEKVTYPRIGYYRERSDEPRSSAAGMLLFIGGAFLLMVLAILAWGDITEASSWRRAAPLMSGISLAGGFWYAAKQSGFVRHRAVAAWSVVSGLVLWLLGSGASYSGIVWHLVGMAIPLAAIGAWELVEFRRDHPIEGSATDG